LRARRLRPRRAAQPLKIGYPRRPPDGPRPAACMPPGARRLLVVRGQLRHRVVRFARKAALPFPDRRHRAAQSADLDHIRIPRSQPAPRACARHTHPDRPPCSRRTRAPTRRRATSSSRSARRACYTAAPPGWTARRSRARDPAPPRSPRPAGRCRQAASRRDASRTGLRRAVVIRDQPEPDLLQRVPFAEQPPASAGP